jgi:hypothetical protein
LQAISRFFNGESKSLKSVALESPVAGELLPPVRGTSQFSYAPITNFMLFNNHAQWRVMSNIQSLFDWFHSNPVFYAVVMIKAREYANMDIQVWNKRTNKMEPKNTLKDVPRALYKLLEKPNVLQSKWEFFLQRKIFLEVAGNSFSYGNFSLGFPRRDISSLISLWNVWPQHMKYKLAGGYFEATKIEDVVSKWKFQAGTYKQEWEPWEILHQNKPNTEIGDDIIFGRSPAQNLVRPLSNIDMAYESRNVIMKNRGMRVVFTSDKGDASGKIALDEGEKDILEKAIKGYGTLEGQKQFFFTDMPVKVTPIDQDVMKLGLFEEIATDAMAVCNGYNVPEILLKLYIKGNTFENQEASVRRLYQGTLIPEAIDDMNALSNFLGLNDTEWELRPGFDHVAALQESEAKKEATVKTKSDRLINELTNQLITSEEYRALMEYGPMPKAPEPEGDGTLPADQQSTETLTAQAALRGSVGGVQGILSIQASVVAGTTTIDSAMNILVIVYGFTKEQAGALLGQPQAA